jgi:hypothetical protein
MPSEVPLLVIGTHTSTKGAGMGFINEISKLYIFIHYLQGQRINTVIQFVDSSVDSEVK